MINQKVKYYIIKSQSLLRHTQFIYHLLFHRERLMHKETGTESRSNLTYFIIRPNSEDGIQGLMSLFIQTMRWIEYAKRKGYVPYVDFLNYKTQYYDGVHNVWDYYFKQYVNLSDIKTGKSVIYSGSSWYKTVDTTLFRDKVLKDKEFAQYCYKLICDNIELSEETNQLFLQEADRLNIYDCLGVYIRGTDYVSLKPPGEYVQPTIDEVIEKVSSFYKKHSDTYIFLVTEDGSYYKTLKEYFGDRIKLTSYDRFVNKYDGKNYLSKSNVLDIDKKRRGMEYFVKILLLSKCKYLISSITMGSLAAYSFNGGKYEEEYFFDLGYYK